MNCIKDGKFTGDSCFGCKVYAVECEIRDKVYRNKWIPVSERLPDEEMGCLVWQKINGHYKYNIWHYVTDFPSNVTAWQPLPEPYKA